MRVSNQPLLWRLTMSECRYCGGECETSDEYMCDGYAGDIDNLYGDDDE